MIGGSQAIIGSLDGSADAPAVKTGTIIVPFGTAAEGKRSVRGQR
jgi:hypothetical protein